MRGFGSKAWHTMRREGLVSLAKRAVRFLVYKGRRLVTNPQPEIDRWRQLRGRFKGRRAFLIGNGPSLNQTPLHLLRDEATMCCNRWDLMLERLAWTPTFYTVIDDRVLLDTIDIVNDITDVVQYAFVPDIHPYNVDFRKHIVQKPNVYWLFLDRASFSEDLPYCGINKTVANVGLQILAFLGFTEIYLLGMDMSYVVPKDAILENRRDVQATSDNDESHFDPRYFGKGRRFHVPMLDETFAKFREGRRFLEARGVTVVNLTVGGKLEEFQRSSLEDVLGVSNESIRASYLSNIQSKLSGDHMMVLIEALSAEVLTNPDQMHGDEQAVRVAVEAVGTFLKKWVRNYVPFGPIGNTHLLVSRQLLRKS